MDNSRITIPLTQHERSALMQLANAEMRSDRDQARFLLREALKSRGFLESRCDRAEPEEARPERKLA